MIIEELIKLYIRDLGRLRTEITLYKNPAKIWVTDKAISNSAGNLCLHLAGNLKTYIGHGLGQIAYERNRELEFSAKDVPVSDLLKEVDETVTIVEQSLRTLKPADLDKDFPLVIWDRQTNMSHTLLHLLSHLNYHLGQVNYHRRLLDDE